MVAPNWPWATPLRLCTRVFQYQLVTPHAVVSSCKSAPCRVDLPGDGKTIPQLTDSLSMTWPNNWGAKWAGIERLSSGDIHNRRTRT